MAGASAGGQDGDVLVDEHPNQDMAEGPLDADSESLIWDTRLAVRLMPHETGLWTKV